MMEAILLTIFILWGILQSKWVWIITVILVIAALVMPDIRQYIYLLFLLFLPGFLCIWAFTSLYMRQLSNEENYIQQGVLAAWSAFQGDVSGAADQAVQAFQPSRFAMMFLNLSMMFLYPAVAALLANVIVLIFDQFLVNII